MSLITKNLLFDYSKIKILLTSVFLLSQLLSCNSGTVSSPTLGGGSDGGGNIYKGKPLESYAQNPQNSSSFNLFVKPLIDDLISKENNGTYELGILNRLMLSVFTQKIWYFVPGPLESIPPDLVGAAIKTDQAVLQGFDRVWVDTNLWNQMSFEDQGRLLLHELFIGLKILRFASQKRLCDASQLNPQESCSYSFSKDLKIKLSPDDYLQVQKSTILIPEIYKNMNLDNWKMFLNDYDYEFSTQWFTVVKPITPDELSYLFEKSELSGYKPNIGYNLRFIDNFNLGPQNQNNLLSYIESKKEDCEINAGVSNNILKLTLKSKTENFSTELPLNSLINSDKVSMFNDSRRLTRISLSHATQKTAPNGGYLYNNIFIGFDSFMLAYVYVQEMVCSNPECNGPEYDLKNGLLYVCGDNEDFFKERF